MSRCSKEYPHVWGYEVIIAATVTVAGEFGEEVSRLNQVQLIQKVAQAAKIKKAAAGRAVKAVVKNIVDSLKSEGRVVIAGLGTFKVKSTKPRTGRNPKTGESIQIAAGRRVLFKPSLGLKKTVKS